MITVIAKGRFRVDLSASYFDATVTGLLEANPVEGLVVGLGWRDTHVPPSSTLDLVGFMESELIDWDSGFFVKWRPSSPGRVVFGGRSILAGATWTLGQFVFAYARQESGAPAFLGISRGMAVTA